MKNKKCALGFVAALAAITGLSSCDKATKSNDGAIFTYTDANGYRTSYTTEDLLKNYRQNGSSLSSEFDKIYEALIRHYYQQSENKGKLSTLQSEATQAVLKDKLTAQTNATNNGTSYEQEFEAILNTNNVDNASELWDKHLYEKEKDLFENDLYENFNLGSSSGVNGYEVLRDGYYTLNGEKKKMFDFKDNSYGDVQDGWLLNQMPYEIRHILVKLNSGSNKNYTTDKISEPTATGEGGEVTKLTTVLKGLAGATIDSSSKKLTSVNAEDRSTFDSLSSYSDDDGSKSAFGEYSKSGEGPMTKSQNSELVHEFIYGVYAFESLYNKRNNDSAKNAYGAANSYRIAPGLSENATSMPTASDDSSVNKHLTVLSEDGSEETVYDYFNNEGIGSIPFGAVMALADAGKIETDDSAAKGKVNDGNESFFPRNVIYNKYFNKHNVCVITPNAIAYNATTYYNDDGSATSTLRASWADENTKAAAETARGQFYNASNVDKLIGKESTDGVYSEQFGNLPGFQVNTKDVLPQFTNNVLTDSAGEIILAVRAGASSYQGIHLMTIKRSALSLYGTSFDGTIVKENTLADVGTETNGKIAYTKDSPSLSDYYTIYTPDSSKYPSANGNKMSTYVNYNVHDNSDYATRAGWISSAIKSSFSDNISTYLFQYLIENGNIEFKNTEIATSIKNYVKIKRKSTKDSSYKTWSDNWKEYAEQLVAQNEERSIGYTATGATGASKLITEAAAIEYGMPKKSSSKLWQKGGACYYASNND